MTSTATDVTHRHGVDADVVVVGAGPVGLLLAGDLAEGGVRVTVLEQLSAPTTQSRASTLHARTMEVLAGRGVLQRLGPLRDGGPGHFGGLRLELADADPDHPYAGQWKCQQTLLEKVLAERATAAGARLRRGVTVTGLSLHDDHVVVHGADHRVRARFVAGCDGETGVVAALAGITSTGQEPTLEMLRADVEGIDIPARRFERHPHGLATAHRWPDGSTRVMVHLAGEEPEPGRGAPPFAEVVAAWRRVTGEDIGNGVPRWLDRFGNARRQADRYRRGRVLLAGDAAHQQMPVGGQALNLGLHDAAELSARLADVVTGRVVGSAAEDTLDGYDAVRRPVGAHTLTNIGAQALLLLGADVEPLRDTIGELMGLPVVRRHLAGLISGLAHPRPRPAPARPSPRTDRRSTTMGRLTERTALVTGSSRGIGRAIAERFGAEGALVAVHYATGADAALETVERIEKDGGRAFAVQAELGVPGDAHTLLTAVERGLGERTGGTRLDILVNNAGVTTPEGQAVEDVTAAEFDRLMAVNARAPFFVTQRALALIPDGGRIINVSSGLTRFANPGQTAYAMTKGAIEQLSLHLARHLAPRGITVNSVAPGITDNGGPIFAVPEAVEQMAQLSAFKRVGSAADVADIVAFLASADARWMTGAFLDATGGTLLG